MSGLPVIEIFGPTLQGEGRLIGCRTMFVRLAGCDWSCGWCDTPYSWRAGELLAAERLDPEGVLGRLRALDAATRRVTVSGGNPALHDGGELCDTLHRARYAVHVETQGSRAAPWLARADSVTVSPKGPSSGMAPDWGGLAATLGVAADPDLKIVVFDEGDIAYAKEVHRRHPEPPLTLQVGNRVGADTKDTLLGKLSRLADLALQDPELADVRVLPQLHVLLWGNKRGV